MGAQAFNTGLCQGELSSVVMILGTMVRMLTPAGDRVISLKGCVGAMGSAYHGVQDNNTSGGEGIRGT